MEVPAGGDKLSTETVYPLLKPLTTGDIPEIDLPAYHRSYTSQAQADNFVLTFGAGLGRIIKNAFALQVIGVRDTHQSAQTF